MNSTDELPFAGDRPESAQAEAPEATCFLDLAEDRLDDGLAAGVVGVTGLGA
jgi:hypothetical protein